MCGALLLHLLFPGCFARQQGQEQPGTADEVFIEPDCAIELTVRLQHLASLQEGLSRPPASAFTNKLHVTYWLAAFTASRALQ